MRRVGAILVTVFTVLLVLGGTGAARADDASSTPNSDAFDTFDIYAQAQAARGTMFAVGGAEGESERLAGAKVEMSKPTNVFAVAAAFQRGLAAGYTYGAVFGRSAAGGLGVAPEPPPGEAVAIYPGEPNQMTWQGPATQATKTVVDGQSYAKATDVPTGRSGISIQHIDVPGQLTIDHGAIASRGEPSADGLVVESSSVLQDITIGKVLKIDRFISRAYGLIPSASGDAKGEASAVVTGASVNGTPVEITSGGIVVTDGNKPQGGEQKTQLQKQVTESLAKANIQDVRLDETTVKPGETSTSIQVTASMLRVSYINNELGQSNPQGFRGGGFELGGATINVTASRAAAPNPTGETTPDVGASPASGSSGSPAAPSTMSRPALPRLQTPTGGTTPVARPAPRPAASGAAKTTPVALTTAAARVDGAEPAAYRPARHSAGPVRATLLSGIGLVALVQGTARRRRRPRRCAAS